MGLLALVSLAKARNAGERGTAGLWKGGRERGGLAPGLGGRTLQAPVLLLLQPLRGWLGLALFPLPYLQTPVICTPICGQMASRLAPGHPAWRRGGLLKLVSGSWGWSRGGGSLPMEEARPRVTLGALNPEPGCTTFH